MKARFQVAQNGFGQDDPTPQAAAEGQTVTPCALRPSRARQATQLARWCALILILRGPVTLWAGDRMVVGDFSLGADARGVPKGWDLVEKSGSASLCLTNLDGLNALLMRSANTSFAVQKQVNVDLEQYPNLTWKWMVIRLPSGGDFRESKTDDQAAQLFLAFSKTKAIVYLWDTTAPQGVIAEVSAPLPMKIKAIVLRSGPSQTGRWITETRNVYQDYMKLFGAVNGPLVVSGVRIQINSQHTKTSAESCFADLVFKKD